MTAARLGALAATIVAELAELQSPRIHLDTDQDAAAELAELLEHATHPDLQALRAELAAPAPVWPVAAWLRQLLGQLPPAPALAFTVAGRPAPKGSLTFKAGAAGRRSRVWEDNPESGPWRTRVNAAARAARRQLPAEARRQLPLEGAALVFVRFRFTPPASYPKTRPIWPTRVGPGDVDKLARNLLDALQDAHVLANDARTTLLVAEKSFTRAGDEGATVDVYEVPGSRP